MQMTMRHSISGIRRLACLLIRLLVSTAMRMVTAITSGSMVQVLAVLVQRFIMTEDSSMAVASRTVR